MTRIKLTSDARAKPDTASHSHLSSLITIHHQYYQLLLSSCIFHHYSSLNDTGRARKPIAANDNQSFHLTVVSNTSYGAEEATSNIRADLQSCVVVVYLQLFWTPFRQSIPLYFKLLKENRMLRNGAFITMVMFWWTASLKSSVTAFRMAPATRRRSPVTKLPGAFAATQSTATRRHLATTTTTIYFVPCSAQINFLQQSPQVRVLYRLDFTGLTGSAMRS